MPIDPEADFDEIAEAQGWTLKKMLCVCRDYIASTDGDPSLLAEYARGVADQENAG